MNLKKELICVFHPYVPNGQQRPFRYKVISINSLPEIIGQYRFDVEVQRFFKKGLEKTNFYVKQRGKVYLYRK